MFASHRISIKNLVAASLLMLLLAQGASAQTYRILVAYTQKAENGMGSNVRNYIRDNAVTLVNLIYSRTVPVGTPVPATVELAGIAKVNYSESGNNGQILYDLRSTTEGQMDEIHSLRNLYAADVVILLTWAQTGLWKGAIICNGPDCTGPNDGIGANEAYAFQIVEQDYLASDYTSAHETGHIFGCRHEFASDDANDPFPYGHGFIGGSSPNYWSDVMATGGSRQEFFSSPDMTHLGQPRGNATQANCTRVHSERSSAIAGFRSPQSNATVQNLTVANQGYADMVAVNSLTTSGNVIFQNGSEVRMRAGSITLNQGVVMEVGSNVTITAGSGALGKSGAGIPQDGSGEEPKESVLRPVPFTISAHVGHTGQTGVLNYGIPKDEEVSFTFFDMRGKTVYGKRLGKMKRGFHSEPLPKAIIGTEMLFLKLSAGNEIVTKKFIGGFQPAP